MKPIARLALGLAIAGAATLTFAQATPPAPGKPAPRHAKIDGNGDGVIDRSEAAKAPKFAGQFDKLDTDKDGRITADERPQRGMRDGKGGRGGQMPKIDTNGDGIIDRSEAAANPRMAQHFDTLDANKDGRITAEERPQHGGKGGREGMRQHMQQLDTDKDGRFSRAELAGKDRMLQNFGAVDANNDGMLSREEMQAYHKAHRGERGGQRPQN